ncbi:unnamed protein product [Phytomonas sp. Hart1]|nr:unnamed protein product [Phytomonas sp. Hart1]|eukprot:CCW71980.1 unnamed protein product [Phytomonas sp. isolate Hart1]
MEPKKCEPATFLKCKHEYWQHRQRVLNRKEKMFNSTPSSFEYSQPIGEGRIRPHQSDRDRQINYDNSKLVDRMLYIMQGQGGINNSPPWRDHNKAINSQHVRELNQRRIAHENLRLLERIEKVESVYKAEDFESAHAQNEIYAARISRYPYPSKHR